MKKIPENKQESEGAERRQGASLLLADAVLLALGGQINAEHNKARISLTGTGFADIICKVKSDLPPGGLLPLHHEAAVEPVNSNQLVVGALPDDLAVIGHEYPVGVAHGFQPVSNHNDRLIVGQFCNGLHQFLFIFGVNIGRGFVQNDDRRVLHNRPGDGNALALAAGKRAACLADDGIKALRQRHDKVVAPCLLCSGLHLLHGGIGLSEADVIGDGVREQISPLEHEGEIADEAVVAVLPHIPSAKAHAA